MDLTGEYRIPAPREAVWQALNDPEILKQSIPGCEEIQKLSDTEMTAKVTARVGPVKASFSGKVTLSDLDPPNGYKISGEGTGGVAGFARGGAEVHLTPDESGAGTILTYTATAAVGGKLAQIGQRLVDSAAKKMADDFFTNFTAYLTAKGAASAPAATSNPASAPDPAPEAPRAAPTANGAASASPNPSARPADIKTKTSPAIWIGVIAVAAAVLIWYLIR